MKREGWASRGAFILAAIGSAVGLGNAWRFPGLAAKYGGGAFLLVYVLAMVVLGFPLLTMELAIGRKMRSGAPGAMRGINKKAEFIGWAGVGNAFFIVCYYAVVLAWVLFMIVEAFSLGSLTGNTEAASKVFMEDVIQAGSITGSYDVPGGMILALLAAWVMIYLCIRNGAKSVGKVVKFTVFLPVIFLLILAIKGFTMPGAGEGIRAYLVPDWAALANPELWIAAFGQVFYSLSIMMAIMIAYGSYVSKSSNLVEDALIVSASDLAISFLAGLVMFSTLGATGNLGNLTESGSVGLAFVVYPMALVTFSSSAVVNSIFAVLFYLTLLTLAIDSAFSIVEGISTAVSDKFKLNRRKTTLNVCLIAGLISVLFATKAGLNWLDLVDYFANNVNLIGIGVLECIAVGWFFSTPKLRQEINLNTGKLRLGAWYDWMIRIVCPLILAALFVWNFVSYCMGGGYGGYPVWAQIIGWVMVAATFGCGFVVKLLEKKGAFRNIDFDTRSWDEMPDEDIVPVGSEEADVQDEEAAKADDMNGVV